jgi:post-segregation antitoxin (ccd killing protein)
MYFPNGGIVALTDIAIKKAKPREKAAAWQMEADCICG